MLGAWIAGLGLAVAAALQPKTHREGHGHHDLVLKHAGSLFTGPFQCHGLKSTELKVRQVGVHGRAFRGAWDKAKAMAKTSLAKILQVPSSKFGAAVLLVIALTAAKPPLLVKAQMLIVEEGQSYMVNNFAGQRHCAS